MAGPSLEDIKAPDPADLDPPGADPLIEKEVKSYESDREEALLDSLRTDTQARKTYATRIYWLAVFWLLSVAVILVCHMFDLSLLIPIPDIGFENVAFLNMKLIRPLPENVLIALVAGSTTGVLGILASVIAYIFRVPK